MRSKRRVARKVKIVKTKNVREYNYNPLQKKMKEINYQDQYDIDHFILPLVVYFNRIGLKTKYSCQGHATEPSQHTYIIFDDSITPEIMNRFLVQFVNMDKLNGKFKYWVRSGMENWVYEIEDLESSFHGLIAMIQDMSIFEKVNPGIISEYV